MTHPRYTRVVSTTETRDVAGVKFSHFQLLEPASQAGRRPLDGGYAMDRDLAVRVDDPAQAHLVELVIVPWDGRLAAGRVIVARRHDTSQPVDYRALRFPLSSYVAGAVSAYMHSTFDPDELLLIARVGTGPGQHFFHALGPDDQAAAAKEATRGQGQRRGKRETLLLAAELYRKALGDPMHRRAPTQYVAENMPCSRGHASRLLTEARNAGLLGPARGTGGGELHQPTTPENQS